MYIENIHFDDVFDIVDNVGTFSFSAQGVKHYAISIAPHMIPRPGITYIVAFKEPKNWHTVVGWREATSNVVILKYSGWLYWLNEWTTGLFFIPFNLYNAIRINRAAQHALSVAAG